MRQRSGDLSAVRKASVSETAVTEANVGEAAMTDKAPVSETSLMDEARTMHEVRPVEEASMVEERSVHENHFLPHEGPVKEHRLVPTHDHDLFHERPMIEAVVEVIPVACETGMAEADADRDSSRLCGLGCSQKGHACSRHTG